MSVNTNIHVYEQIWVGQMYNGEVHCDLREYGKEKEIIKINMEILNMSTFRT